MSESNSQKVRKCKAAICWKMGEELKVEEIQVEAPKYGEVRVKMLCASLCHTDILFAQGNAAAFEPYLFPRVLGHEGVGKIESVGEGVTKFKEGDLIIPTYLGECGECENCKSEKSNLCQKYPLPLSGRMQDGTSRMSVGGKELYHFFTCSTWSEYTVVDAAYIVKVDSETPLPHASLISCGFSTGYGAAWKEAKVERGSSVAIFGLGAVGLGVVEGARMQGAKTIIGIDKNEGKRKMGEAFGMTDFINSDGSSKSPSELVKDLTEGMGVDYSFECTGVVSFANEAVEATKMGKGTAILLGVPSGTSVEIKFLPLLLGRTLKGSTFGGIKVQSDLPTIADKSIKKEIQLDALLTHEVSLEDINKAFELMKQPDCVKVIINI